MQEASNGQAAANWYAEDLANDTSWLLHLDDEHLKELESALRKVQSLGIPIHEVTREQFALNSLSGHFASLADQLHHGRGLGVIRGLPTDQYDKEEVETIFWGIGTHIGLPARQNIEGDLMGHVRDAGKAYGEAGVRGYQSNAHLPFHSDLSDVVGLCCLRQAKSGGASSVVSAVTIHNEMSRRAPELLEPLYNGFHFVKRHAELQENPYTDERIPVFARSGDKLYCRYLRVRIDKAADRGGFSLSDDEIAALDLFDEIAHDPRMHYDMYLQPGDMQFCNNYVVLHSRTGFEDWPQSDRKRHMLRLWLIFREDRPDLPAKFPFADGYARPDEPGHDSALRLGFF